MNYSLYWLELIFSTQMNEYGFAANRRDTLQRLPIVGRCEYRLSFIMGTYFPLYLTSFITDIVLPIIRKNMIDQRIWGNLNNLFNITLSFLGSSMTDRRAW